MPRNVMILVLLLLVLAPAASAELLTYPLPALQGDYAAAVGQSTKAAALDLPSRAGVVTDVFIRLAGDYAHGMLQDRYGVSEDWNADLIVIVENDDRRYHASATPVVGGFDVHLPVTPADGAGAPSLDFLGEGSTSVNVALLASSDDGLEIVSYPSMALAVVELVLHSRVENEETTWSGLKTLYR
jgi:hypothetical protein